MRIGLVVNPVAGLGGAVGLKGTDGPGIVAEALRRGAVPHSGPRARRTLARVAARCPGAALAMPPGTMGTDWADGLPLSLMPAGEGARTGSARDTREAVAALGPCDIVVFAGGDGTARDVAESVAPGTAILGIPCGVKMHSGVFALSPEAAGDLVADLLAGAMPQWDETAEVMDIDEAELREGRLAPRLFAHARVPRRRQQMQAAKGGPREDAALALAAAARELAAGMLPGVLYVIGPGTSAGTVMRALGHEPTLLGTDALRDGQVVARDAGADELERLAGAGPVVLVLGVTGRQGFLLGRGNQQISPALIARAGPAGLVVLATEDKLAGLARPRLWLDTGDPALDARLAGYLRVRTGAGRVMIMRATAAG